MANMQIYGTVPATLTVNVVEAVVDRQTDWLGKDDPFCRLKYKDLEFNTEVHQSAGKTPVWEQIFEFDVQDPTERIFLEVLDSDLLGTQLMGFANIKVSSLMINAEKEPVDEWFSLYYNNKRVGQVHLKSTLKFKEGSQIGQKELKDTLEYKIANLKKQYDENCEEIIKFTAEFEKQKNEYEENKAMLDESTEKRQQVDKQYGAYANFDRLFLDTSKNFDYIKQEIIIDQQAVSISSCNDDDRSLADAEKAWQLIGRENKKAGTRWLIKDFKKYGNFSWVIFKFNQPILVRGYGIRSCNDCPEKDPSIVEVQAHDFLINGKNEKAKKHVLDQHKITFKSRNELIQRNFLQRLTTEMKFKFQNKSAAKDMQICQIKLYC